MLFSAKLQRRNLNMSYFILENGQFLLVQRDEEAPGTRFTLVDTTQGASFECTVLDKKFESSPNIKEQTMNLLVYIQKMHKAMSFGKNYEMSAQKLEELINIPGNFIEKGNN